MKRSACLYPLATTFNKPLEMRAMYAMQTALYLNVNFSIIGCQLSDVMRCRLQCRASLGGCELQKALSFLVADHGASRSISSTVSKNKENFGQVDSETTE